MGSRFIIELVYRAYSCRVCGFEKMARYYTHDLSHCWKGKLWLQVLSDLLRKKVSSLSLCRPWIVLFLCVVLLTIYFLKSFSHFRKILCKWSSTGCIVSAISFNKNGGVVISKILMNQQVFDELTSFWWIKNDSYLEIVFLMIQQVFDDSTSFSLIMKSPAFK